MNGPGDVPQPIPYQGSKRQIAPLILRYFPSGINRLVEPFAGSAVLSIAVAARRQAACFWINDAHSQLIELWQKIICRPNELAEQYAFLWNDQLGRERSYFDVVRDRFNKTHDPADFLYLLARTVKAAIRYNAKGEFNNTPDNRRKGVRPDEMRRRLYCTSFLLRQGTRITSRDYKKVLNDCTEEDVVYMDPLEIRAGRSAQATLLGRSEITYESLYLSPALASLAGVSGYGKERQCALL